MGAQVALTREAFEVEMRRLVGLKFPPVDLDTHWEALRDMPEPLLSAAVSAAQREADEFPSPKMLRVLADRERARVLPVGPEPNRATPAPERSVDLPAGRVLRFNREWRYYCDDCSDTGWRTFVCGSDFVKQGADGKQVDVQRHPWADHAHCGRDGEHLAHSWSTPCACVATNPAVLRKRERDVQLAAQRARAKGDAA